MRLGFVFTIVCVLFVVQACNKTEINPTEQLKKLRVERAKLDDQIRDLETTVGSAVDVTELTPVTVLSIREASFAHEIDVKGSVDSRSSVSITPRTAGQITGIKVVNGQSVNKGQLLVELDAEIVRRSMDEVEVQLEFARTLFQKQQRIYEQKAGSEIQYLSSKNQLESLEKRLQSLKEQLSLSKIYAPTSGFVDNVLPKVGENIMPGMPIMTIVNNSDNRILVDLSEVYVSTVNTGDPVVVILTETNDTIRTKIGTVSKLVNPLNRTFRVEIPVNGKALGVRPNSTCNVSITDQVIQQALAIPMNAVVRENEKSFVFIVNDKDEVERREVSLGLVSGPNVQIIAGLNVTEKLVVRGVLDVAAGQKVRVVE
ncbi:MAG: efflux RND transporter periplasmic adaptor subunit [Ignavibacteria bacterium]|nr:efflux RND transporter periplasmic adaptor subunit [Ignavibacteria bacterium]